MENRRILESWKEISAHLGRNTRTCQRWEIEQGLPIHRLDGTPKARVYAYADELDRWLEEKLGSDKAKFDDRELGRAEDLKRLIRPKKLFVPVASLIVLIVTAMLLWRYVPRKGGAPALNPKRVVVAPFENRTGDASLDPLGKMAAESVSEGLLQIGAVDVIPSSKVFNLSAAQAGAQTEGDSGRALAGATGAGLVVSGAYYVQGQTLQMEAIIMDVVANRPLYAIEPATGLREKAMEAVEAVRQRVVDMIAARYFKPFLNLLLWEVKPPRYEAQKECLTGDELYGSDLPAAILHFKRALELEPEFVLPRFRLAAAFMNQGKFAELEAQLDIIAKTQERLTPLSRRVLDLQRALLAGRLEDAYNTQRDIVKLDPGNPFAFEGLAWYAMYANRPRETVEVFRRQIPWDPLMKPEKPLGAVSFLMLTGALHELGEHEKELKEARRGRGIYPDLLNLRAYEARALVALGRLDEVDRLVDEILAMPSRWGYPSCCLSRGTPGYVMLSATEELRAHGHREASLKMAGRSVEWYRSRTGEEAEREDTRSGLGDSLYQAERWEEAESVFGALAAEHPDNIDYKGRLGALAARRGDRAEALRIAEELRCLDRPFLYGNQIFRSARIIALLGDKERAFALLREAVAQGSGSEEERESYGYGFIYAHSMDLESLRGYPPFEELIKPKG